MVKSGRPRWRSHFCTQVRRDFLQTLLSGKQAAASSGLFLGIHSPAGTRGFLPTAESRSTAAAQRERVQQPRAVSGCSRSPTPGYPVSWLVAQPLAPVQRKRQVSKSPEPSCRLRDVNVLTQAPLPGKGGRPEHSSGSQGCLELGHS